MCIRDRFIADAALAVVVVADPLASDVWIEDASIASIYLQLQAEDMGRGNCWVQVRVRFTASGLPSGEYVYEVFDIPLEWPSGIDLPTRMDVPVQL